MSGLMVGQLGFYKVVTGSCTLGSTVAERYFRYFRIRVLTFLVRTGFRKKPLELIVSIRRQWALVAIRDIIEISLKNV